MIELLAASDGAGLDWVELIFGHLKPVALFTVAGFTVTNQMIAEVIVGGGLVVLLGFMMDTRSLRPTGVIRGIIEPIVLFVRDDMVYDMMGRKEGDRFLSFFLSMFFFILGCNLLGLVPLPVGLSHGHWIVAGTATGNWLVTGALAFVTFCAIHVIGMKDHGLKHWPNMLLPPGLPVLLIPLMMLVEFLGMLTKPFALMVRLFANMTGGHVIILVFVGFIFLVNQMAGAAWIAMAPVSIVAVVVMTLFEVFIGFIQAYIFTLLSIVFIQAAVHPEH